MNDQIIAAAILGIVNAGGVVVAAMLLRFHYRNQLNPIRVEIYKRQADIILSLVSQCYAVYALAANAHLPRDTEDKEKDLLRTIAQEVRRVRDTMRSGLAILPSQIILDVEAFIEAIEERLGNDARTPTRSNVQSGERKLEQIIASCRTILGTDELSDGVAYIIRSYETGKVTHSK